MKILFKHTRLFTLLLTLLLLGSVANEAWAYKVTYHILTLPINNSIYHMSTTLNGKRLEAVRVVDNNATTVNLPDAYKSPLVKTFTYYLDNETNIEKHDAVRMYDWGDKDMTCYYEMKAGATPINTAEYTVSSNIDVYVTYDYDEDNTIADLSGEKEYNLTMSDGFLALNRGRNNRIAVFQKSLDLVKAEDLVSEDFVQYPYTSGNVIAGTKIGTYWQSNDNKNTKANVAGQFHFIFKFEGSDPYNIIIGTTYDKDYTYIEKHGSENSFRYKWYKGSHLFRPSSDGTGYFMASDDHKEYTKSGTTYNPDPDPDLDSYSTERSGYFKSKGIAEKNFNYSTFALLNNSNSPSNGYVFMVSRFVNGEGDLSTPGDYKSASYNYLIRDDNYNNLTYKSLTLANVSKSYSTDQKIYQVENYVYKLTKKISGTQLAEKMRVSEYYLGDDPLDFIPEALKRKYVTYKAYSDAEMNNEVTTFTAAAANCVDDPYDAYNGYKVIYLDYEVNMPFETSATSATYGDLKWYNIHAEKNASYILSWDESKVVTRNVLYRYPRRTHFAFIGDPYDLKIVSRTASQDGSGNPSTLKYMELNSTLENYTTFETGGTTWGIVYDDNTADNLDCFRLKDFTSGNYLHIKNASGESYPLNGTTTLDDAVRITVDNLPNKNYSYYIMRSDNSIAVWTSGGRHEPSAKLGFDFIPKEIRSPYLKDNVTLTFYGGTTDESTAITNATSKTSAITYAPDTENGGVQYIVVRYDDFKSSPQKQNIDGIPDHATYNVRLNGQFIYYDTTTASIKSSTTIEDKDGDESTSEYNWILGGSDPYAMNIKSVKAGKFIKIDSWPEGDEEGVGTTITWSADAPSSKYIIKSSTEENTYEVMGATEDGFYDAIEESFNFGRPDPNTVKMYSDWSYLSGSDVLRFELIKNTAVEVTYHLVDIKNNDVLLSVKTRQEPGSAPSFPPDYRSPLVETYTYWSNLTDAQNTEGTNPTTVAEDDDIYVTYTANNLVDMTGKTTYLMKYALGDQFRQEDGSDGLLPEIPTIPEDDSKKKEKEEEKKYRYQAIYPYCNGDCNFFVYGQEQYDIQQQSAASTRTRWAWYVESVSGDPYHVKISSRQQEIYPTGSENYYNAYFRTYKPSGYSEVVTTLAWPGISGEQGTEYMVLGSAGQFRLLTTYGIDLNNDGDISDSGEDVRRPVDSFEQYWKTWNTIRLKVLGDKNAEAKPSDPTTVPATPAAPTAAAAGMDNRTYLTDEMGWHSYENWAYGIRWNDYNKNGDKNKKGWESIEHWYQTIKMGEGYFDFVKTSIDPVLILLDQHGWEVMRKPLPSSPDDPYKYEKYDAIRPYDSPMVKEYHFWTKTSKRTGYHQYHTLDQRITVDGEPYASTSLTDLPPFDATNVHDNKGNLLDQYVTYVVKDEYVKSLGKPFMIQQGKNFVYNNSDAIGKYDLSTTTGGMSQYIITNVGELTTTGSKKNELWYLKPNPNIDDEMGYANYDHNWTNDYTKTDFSENGFDPYNIQISSVSNTSKYFVTNATGAKLDDGILVGDASATSLFLGAQATTVTGVGHDYRDLQITNATFMAVLDEDGSMQLMPRFDQEKRLKDFTALVQTDDAEEEKTHTILYRPEVYNYHIIDNSGEESLRYQGGGDLLPQTPGWFQSQLAKDYTYHTAKPCTDANKITESLDGATLTDNNVYVRYSYDEDADYDNILKGKWLTMSVNGKDAQYTTVSETAGIYSGDKPDPVDGTKKTWQWKFIASSETDPDPYAVSLYNRNTSAGTATAVNGKTKFALLNWYDENGVDATKYTLAVAGTESYTYSFVNGDGMKSSVAATTAAEDDVTSTSCSYTGTQAQIILNDDVEHNYVYKVYTNEGKFAVSATQENSVVSENDYAPVLPEEIKSPLLNIDQFRYYDNANFTFDGSANIETADTIGKALDNLYGMYDDIVIVRYTPYNLKATEYKVPNVRNATSETIVARDESSNDAALDINDELLYNIFWHDDEIMKAVDTSEPADGIYDGLNSDTDHKLDGAEEYVWKFEGNDPYAIKIKHNKSGKYAVGADALADGATSTFMLLPSTDSEWQYGVLQVTGGTNKLSGYGQTTVAADPKKFIIFGLSTHTVIYHLVIANIGSSETIPYSESNSPRDSRYTSGSNELVIQGSTNRDLTSKKDDDDENPVGSKYQLGKRINGVNYCVNEGHITLGDPLKVPEALKRPNCKYFYYVEGVYTDEDCSRAIPYGTTGSHIDALDAQYRGLQITQMGTEPELLGKTVRINVEYQFDDGLPTNNGTRFVTNTNGTQWYTFETSDDTPYMAHYTYKDAKLTGVEGRIGHYTNDFLWSPVGDPYGFKMYNRYVYKNYNHTGYVMTAAAAPAADVDLNMSDSPDPTTTVYELWPAETDGYFKVPVLTIPESPTTYYLDNSAGVLKLKESTETEWTFGLSDALLDPYYLGAGNVGGLTTDDTKKPGQDKSGVERYEEATNLIEKQGVVFNPVNIVDFTPGYYRIFNEPNSLGIRIPQYLSGYTHQTELTSSIPMHFYEKKGVTTTFETLGSGFTTTTATQGQIPIEAPEYDPASIFYISSGSGNAPYTMQTQGLYVDGAAMATSAGTHSNFNIDDIGGAVVVLHDGAANIADRYYLNYDQTDADHIYDVKYTNNIGIADQTKWCMEPANKMGLYIETHSGNEEETLTNLWYYSSYCVPFDMLIANKDDDPDHSSNAYTCVVSESPWNGTMLHPKPIGKYNTGTYQNNDYFVPAGTPVLFSTRRATSYIKATIPTTAPSARIPTIFSARYLEQKLPGWDNNNRVYVFGPKMEGTLTLNESTGEVTATLASLGNTNVGFHINANPNKESSPTKTSWTRNNYYVLHNRIYYIANVAASAQAKAAEFVPVIFDFDEDMEEDEEMKAKPHIMDVTDDKVYDLQGRCIATGDEVLNGSWMNSVAPGLYIIGGKKVHVGN